MAEYIEKEKLLIDINNGIKAGNYEEGYEQYQNINNMNDIIETIKYSDTADVIERSKVDKAIEEIKALSPTPTAEDVVDGNPVKDAVWETLIEVEKIIKRNIGE